MLNLEERIEQLKHRKAEIDSKISNNEQLAARIGSKPTADPVWKKYQMQQQSRAQQDAARIKKSTSLHNDVFFY